MRHKPSEKLYRRLKRTKTLMNSKHYKDDQRFSLSWRDKLTFSLGL